MIRVTAEIGEGALTQRQQITAPSIEQALSFVAERYPSGNVRVRFPIEPEGFFVREPTAQAGKVSIEERDAIAA
jgi:hypothetical protein